jgi:tRNA dimethylallyltransferase
MALVESLATRSVRAEVVVVDSIQIYRGLDIGSAKPTREEQRLVPHHLIDIVEPTERFSVDAWLGRAEEIVGSIRSRGAVPILVGGTHLYVKAFLEGLFEGPEPDESLRQALRAMDPGARRAELERVDPRAAARIHPADERRAVRALEVFRLTGRPITDWQQEWDTGRARRDCLLVGLDWETEPLNRRINARVKAMIDAGLVEETRALHEAGRFGPQAREALGYKQILAHFNARLTLEDATEQVKIETRRFAKNQRTWLRRLRTTPESAWFSMPGTGVSTVVETILARLESAP